MGFAALEQGESNVHFNSCELKNGVWTIKVRKGGHHNDGISTPPAHPIQRRVNEEIRSQIQSQMLSGRAPREVVSTIRQNTDHTIIKQDVYNIRMTLKNLAGKTLMKALISVLQTGVYIVNYKQDATGRLTPLFCTIFLKF